MYTSISSLEIECFTDPDTLVVIYKDYKSQLMACLVASHFAI